MHQTHANLEQERWTDKNFTGDSVKFTANLVEQVSARDTAIQRGGRNLIADLSAASSKPSARTTKDKDASAPSYLDLSPTDVAAVKDIRRALRRKYASRSNLGRIFAQWDKGSKGSITMEDLVHGITRAGITMTHEQACTLFASAKAAAGESPAREGLTQEEFGKLLFSGDETLNVNLRQIPAPCEADRLAMTQKLSQCGGRKHIDLASLTPEQLA